MWILLFNMEINLNKSLPQQGTGGQVIHAIEDEAGNMQMSKWLYEYIFGKTEGDQAEAKRTETIQAKHVSGKPF